MSCCNNNKKKYHWYKRQVISVEKMFKDGKINKEQRDSAITKLKTIVGLK